MAGRTRTLGPAMGIAVLVAVLVAVAAGWLVVRGRRGAEAVPRMDRPGAAGTAAGHAAAAEDDPAGPAEEQDLLPERAIFGRLCAAGFGDAALEGTLLDEATAGEALERIHAHPRYIPRRPALLLRFLRRHDRGWLTPYPEQPLEQVRLAHDIVFRPLLRAGRVRADGKDETAARDGQGRHSLSHGQTGGAAERDHRI